MLRLKLHIVFLLLIAIGLGGQVSTESLQNRAETIIYDQPDEAISITLKLLKKERKVDEVAHLYMLISNAYIVKKNTDSSLFYILKATDLINSAALPETKIKILFSVAVQYQQMELYDKALESLDKAQEMIDKSTMTYSEHLYNSGFMNSTRGIIYRNQSNPDLALEKFKLSAKNFNKLKLDKTTSANLSINCYNMGNCYLDLSKLQQAFSNFKEAEKYATKYKENILEAYALKGQGESYFLMHQYEQSLQVLSKAEKIADPIGDLVLNEGIYKLIANNNLALNNIEDFQNYNNKSSEILKILEQDELKSLNRYLNTQNSEQLEFNSKVEKRFVLYQSLAIILTLSSLAFLLKKSLDLLRKNRRQKKIIERLTQSKAAL